jgi:hypothetical protein
MEMGNPNNPIPLIELKEDHESHEMNEEDDHAEEADDAHDLTDSTSDWEYLVKIHEKDDTFDEKTKTSVNIKIILTVSRVLLTFYPSIIRCWLSE